MRGYNFSIFLAFFFCCLFSAEDAMSQISVGGSDKLDYSKETKIIPMGEINNKTYLFTYKDDKDYFITKH